MTRLFIIIGHILLAGTIIPWVVVLGFYYYREGRDTLTKRMVHYMAATTLAELWSIWLLVAWFVSGEVWEMFTSDFAAFLMLDATPGSMFRVVIIWYWWYTASKLKGAWRREVDREEARG